MSELYFAPQWFFGYDIALEILFALVTLSVAAYSFYIYRLSAQKECRLFGASFTFVSLSYFLWAGINFFIVSHTGTLTLENLSFAGSVGVFGHVLLLLLGWGTLAYTTLNTRSYRAYSLFVSLPLITVIFSAHKVVAFYFTSSVLLLYVLIHYVLEFKEKRRLPNFLIMVAFMFLLLGNIDFTFASIYLANYVIGHILHFLAYMLILISFIKTVHR